MFVGHYAASLALKNMKSERRSVSFSWLFSLSTSYFYHWY